MARVVVLQHLSAPAPPPHRLLCRQLVEAGRPFLLGVSSQEPPPIAMVSGPVRLLRLWAVEVTNHQSGNPSLWCGLPRSRADLGRPCAARHLVAPPLALLPSLPHHGLYRSLLQWRHSQ